MSSIPSQPPQHTDPQHFLPLKPCWVLVLQDLSSLFWLKWFYWSTLPTPGLKLGKSFCYQSICQQPHMYTYSAVVHFFYRIGYAEENDNKVWYVGKSISVSLCVSRFITKYYIHHILLSWYFLQRYADIFNHFLRWLTGRDYFTLRLLHWGEWVQQIQWIYRFIMLYFLLVQLASCTLNKVYISSTLILSVIVSIMAILPWVQKGTTIS